MEHITFLSPLNGTATKTFSLDRDGHLATRPYKAGTRQATKVIAAGAADLCIYLLVPTHAKAEEQAQEYAAMAGPASPPVIVMRGRSADDQEKPGEPMCPRHEVAYRLAGFGFDVQERLCNDCRFQTTCGYQRQRAAVAAMGERGLFIGSHEYAWVPAPGPTPDVAIIDESVVTNGAATKLSFHPDRIVQGANWKTESEGADFYRVAKPLYDALVQNCGRELASLRHAGIERRDIWAAVRCIERAKGDVVAKVKGDMSDAEINAALDALKDSELDKVDRLLRQVHREYGARRAGLNSIVYDSDAEVTVDDRRERQGRVTVYYLRGLRMAKDKSLLLIDGTANLALNSRIFGAGLTETRVAIERDAHVVGTRGREFSRQSITGETADGRPISATKSAEAESLRKQLVEFIGQASGRRKFVAATKKAMAKLAVPLEANSDVQKGHFGALRGLNAHQDCDTAIVIGREQVAAVNLEALTRAYTADDDEPFFSTVCDEAPGGALVPQTRMRRLRGGGVEPQQVLVHPDPRCQAMLEQIREAEIEQAVDRVRPIFNHRQLYLLSNQVVNITYHVVRDWPELAAGGTRFERAAERGPAVPTSPTELVRCFPGLWPSAEAAEQDLRRSARKPLRTPNSNLLGNRRGFCRAEYRRPGQRGSWSPALIRREHSDPRAALEQVVGAVTAFRLVDEGDG